MKRIRRSPTHINPRDALRRIRCTRIQWKKYCTYSMVQDVTYHCFYRHTSKQERFEVYKSRNPISVTHMKALMKYRPLIGGGKNKFIR